MKRCGLVLKKGRAGRVRGKEEKAAVDLGEGGTAKADYGGTYGKARKTVLIKYEVTNQPVGHLV